MLVYDFSDASLPQFVARLNLPSRWPHPTLTGEFLIVVRWPYALVPSWDTGFYVVDIMDLASPIVVSATNLPQTGRSVSLLGDLAFVGGGNVTGRVVDISIVETPQVVGSLPPFPAGLYSTQIVGAYMYAASGRVFVVDLTDPIQPVIVDTALEVGSCFDFAIQGHRLHAVDVYPTFGLEGMGCFDISNPVATGFLGSLSNGGGDVSIAVQNDRAYVVNGSGGLYAVDISDPSNPTPVICYRTGTAASCSVTVGVDYYGVTLFDRFAFIGGNNAGLLAFELDPRGDVSADGTVSSSDIISLVNFVFKSGPPPASPTQSDTNCSQDLTASDVIILVNYVFKGTNVPVCP